jgi:uncharacterized repeat protein (TIGR03803 family)
MTLTSLPVTDSRTRVRIPGGHAAALAALCFLLAPFSLQAEDAADLIAGAGLGGPVSSLITGSDGNRYGVTADGGPVEPGGLPAVASGTVFRLAPDDSVTVLHVFSIQVPDDGWGPAAALVEGADGHFYGTTAFGGEYCTECGTIFRITPQGVHTRLHSFNGADGAAPSTALTVGGDGRLYGVTDGSATGVATLFAITTDGQFELLRTETAESSLATTQTLAVEMLATVQTFDANVFPDPATPLLDNFNRPNSTTLGENWTVLPPSFVEGPNASASIDEFTAISIQSGPHGNYWNAPFDEDQEAYGVFPNIDRGYDDIGLAIRYNPQTGTGYAVMPHYAGVSSLSLVRLQNDQPVTLAETGFGFTLPNPSWIGIRATSDHITVWLSSDGNQWEKVLETTDINVQGGGHAAIWLNNAHRFDDFHAGSLNVPPPPDDDGDDGNGGDDGENGDDGGGDNDNGNDPGNIDPEEDVTVTPITGSPGGGRRGGIGLGAAGPEALALLLLLWGRTTVTSRIRKIFRPIRH